jgi:hypothetical protein
MKSVRLDFGSEKETESEGKGLDWMLDPFLQRKTTGQAGFDYEIVRTRPDIIADILNDRQESVEITRILKSYDFHTLFLSMNVKMNDPDSWALSWARFEYEMVGENLGVLAFSPTLDGVKTTIERTGSRELNMSLSAELGPPAAATSLIDAKISPDISYDKKTGWTVRFDTTVEEVRGFKTRTTNGKINLQWDVYKNKALQVPESNIGVTSGVYATALISSPKDSKPIVNVKVSGETVRKGTSLRSRGMIELASRGMFNIQPTL